MDDTGFHCLIERVKVKISLDIMFLPDNPTSSQKRVLSEFFTNLSVAWFVATVISPIISPGRDLGESVLIIVIGMAFTFAHLNSALKISKDI